MANINNMTIAETLLGNNLVTTSKSFFGLISKSVYRPTGSRLTALKKEYDPLTGNKIEYALNADACKRAHSGARPYSRLAHRQLSARGMLLGRS